jgi:hypothetical protein
MESRDFNSIVKTEHGTVYVASRRQLEGCAQWKQAHNGQRKDHRYHEIVEETIQQGFDYRYFVLEDLTGEIKAIQPFFLLRQDLIAGAGAKVQKAINAIRQLFPTFLTMRTLMVGCAAGEGHLDHGPGDHNQWIAKLLHSALVKYAKQIKHKMIVLKEFPHQYRKALSVFSQDGYTRVPSLPMTRLNIDYPNFDEYMTKALSHATRKDLRRKFKATKDHAIEMQVVQDISPFIDEVYPLYLQVYNRSHMHFEKLTPEYMKSLGTRMPDKTRFFIWRQNGKAVAFSLCMLNDQTIYDEYLGLDYSVALDLHLYFYTFRDIVSWAMDNGYKWYCSSALNYDPKLRFKCELVPLDLYVCHTSPLINPILKRVLPLLEPTRGDKTLAKFENSYALWADAAS